MVHQNDRSVILHVSDDSPNGLVHGSGSLLRVPLGACETDLVHLILLLKILFLQYDNRVSHLRVRDSDKHDATCCIV